MTWTHWLKRKVTALFFPTVREIVIAQSVLDNVSEMARSAHPKEMLAFFAASRGNKNGVVVVDEVHLQAYDASEDSASVMLGNLPMTTSIVGTVHSHPGGSRRPSDADLHLFSKFGYLHAILGEPYRPQDIAFFDKNGRRVSVRIDANA